MKNNIKLLLTFAVIALQAMNSYAPAEMVMEEYSEMNEEQLTDAQTKAQEELTAAEEARDAEEANAAATAQSQSDAQNAVSAAQAKLLEIATAMNALVESVGGSATNTGGVTMDFDPNETEDVGEDGLTDSERGGPEPTVAEAVPTTSSEIADLPQATVVAIESVVETFIEGSTTQTTVDDGVTKIVNAEGNPIAKIQAFFDMIGKGFAGLFEMIGDAFSNMFKKSSSSSSPTVSSFAEVESLSDDQIQDLKDATVTTAAEAQSFFNLEDGYTEEDLENASKDKSLTKANLESLMYDQDPSIQENITAAYALLAADAIPEGLTWVEVEVEDDESIEDETPTAPAQPAISVNSGWSF